jgi:hypothetical protein
MRMTRTKVRRQLSISKKSMMVLGVIKVLRVIKLLMVVMLPKVM